MHTSRCICNNPYSWQSAQTMHINPAQLEPNQVYARAGNTIAFKVIINDLLHGASYSIVNSRGQSIASGGPVWGGTYQYNVVAPSSDLYTLLISSRSPNVSSEIYIA